VRAARSGSASVITVRVDARAHPLTHTPADTPLCALAAGSESRSCKRLIALSA